MIQSCSPLQAKAYFGQTDYFLNDQESPGYFYGRLAARLGISSLATRQVFAALCDNLHPLTAKPLTPRTTENRTVGYDISFHPPKSVSVLHVLAHDDHILKAFQTSVQETMLDVEKDMQTRVRCNGQDEDRKTEELLWTEFIHQTARPVSGFVPDMHLHAHCFTFNVTWDLVEQRLKAAQFRDIKRDMPYYQARFYKRLSDQLIQLGYQVRPTKQSFEVVGVPQNVIRLFSKRTSLIERYAKEHGITNALELDQLGAQIRNKKQKSLSLSQLKQDWRDQIFALGMSDASEGNAPLRYAPPQPKPVLLASQCLDHALALRLERASVVQDRRILATAYQHSLGHPDLTLEIITDVFKRDDRIITVMEHGKPLCTTRQVLSEEQQMVNFARQGQGALIPLYRKPPALELKGEQAQAVKHVLTTCNRVSIIQGRAGTGKTTLMKEAVRFIEQSGKKVILTAPTAQASRGVLQSEGFEAETVAKLLSNSQLQAQLKDNVLWVDEAGLLGTKDMSALLELTIKQNARLILSGDTRQHAPVLRGDALRILNTVAGIPSAQVSQIFRQKQPLYREAVQQLSEGHIKQAFERLGELKALNVIDPLTGFEPLAKAYVEVIQTGKTALAICPTHQQGVFVTDAIRQRLRDVGRISEKEYLIPQLINQSSTEAEKKDCRSYQRGQTIQFNQTVGNIRRGARCVVKTISNLNVEIAQENGDISLLPLESSSQFEVYQNATLSLSVGDQIRITRNSKTHRLYNGQMLEVIGISETGDIQVKNRTSKLVYTLPRDFGHISHAYCLTSHASQGKTVDEIFIAQPAASFVATNLNQFYVSVSRARHRVHIYTDDIDGLINQSAQAGDRTSALELLARPIHEQVEQVVRQQQLNQGKLQKQSPVNPSEQSSLKGLVHVAKLRL